MTTATQQRKRKVMKVFGKHHVTGVIMWMGEQGFPPAHARRALEAHGVRPAETTLRTFLNAGLRGGKAGHNGVQLNAAECSALLAHYPARED